VPRRHRHEHYIEAIAEPFVACIVAGLYPAAHTGSRASPILSGPLLTGIEGNDHGQEKLSAGGAILSNRWRRSVSDSINRGMDAIGSAANEAANSAGSDLQAIRNDLNNLKDTLSRFMSQTSSEAVKSAREVTSNFAGQVGDAASDLATRGSQLASSAGDQAKTFATELESMARRNPLGALAGAVAVGVLIGIMGRRS
jgi:ElaB/YqjD/DUF883 family membrane-anchored ribosome-binding protein